MDGASVIVSSPTIGAAIKEAVNLLEHGSNDDVQSKLEAILSSVISATYPPPRTRPYVRLILPLLLNAITCAESQYPLDDFRALRRYTTGFLRREFPEILPNSSHQSEHYTPRKKEHPKKNKDKYNKETRPGRHMLNKK